MSYTDQDFETAASPTPGPWTIRERPNTGGGFYVEPGIGEVYGLGRTPEANGRLIAAAPDLLAALKALQAWAEHTGGWEALCWAQADAAIAKATGR